MKHFLRLLFDTRNHRDRLVVVETSDSLGYRVERIPVIPDTPDDLIYLIDGEGVIS